jgi:hypothetical protein
VPDAPELTLRRTVAQLLDDWDLAVYAPTGPIPALGIRLDGVMPTIDEFTMISSPTTVAEGRADCVYRLQFFTRRRAGRNALESWADTLRSHLDRKEYLPNVLGISWAWEASCEIFDADSSGRAAVAANYYFRGRRP